MSDNVKELLGQVADDNVRSQLESVFNELSGSTLRKNFETAQERVKELEAKDRTRAFKDAGFDPDAGPGKALAKLYEGDADPDAIRQFAKDEFGFEPGVTSTATPDPAAQRAAGEERTAALHAGAIPVRDPSADDQIAKAQADGDWDKANRLNAQKLLTGR